VWYRGPMADATVRELRERISATDLALLEAANRRLELVAELKAYKESVGLPFVDRGREEEMLTDLQAANPGPLSAAGVEALFRAVLDVVKREVA
jgi:3-deoxy-7-phosphoheptulonate synthase / chorismate mutase